MADDGIAQMQIEAGEPDPPLPTIVNVHEPPAPLQPVGARLDPAIPGAASLGTPQAQPTAPIPTVAPRTATPSRPVNGTTESTAPMPTKATSHGAPARRYLNEKVTGVLLEGMKKLAAEQ
ncbi:MAG: hypothetical protein Q9217_005058 [Psora testacea]